MPPNIRLRPLGMLVGLLMNLAHAQPPAVPGQSETLVPYEAYGDDENASSSQPRRVLRVPADPNNLPFTNKQREGFENKIAELLARELQADLIYEWRAQRRGFFRQSLKEGDCNLVLGVPEGSERALTTTPYYSSTYCFVYRHDRNLNVRTLDDTVLRNLKIGVELVGDDGNNPPPAHALAARGLIDNVVGFTVYGDYTEPNPPARVIDAAVRGDVDVAIVWGPRAGYFAKNAPVALEVVPLTPALDRTGLPFVFSISMGVREHDASLLDELNALLLREQGRINKILDDYGVPLAETPKSEHATPKN